MAHPCCWLQCPLVAPGRSGKKLFEQSWAAASRGQPDVGRLQFDVSADVEVTGDEQPVVVGAGVAVGF